MQFALADQIRVEAFKAHELSGLIVMLGLKRAGGLTIAIPS
jgi:hypothetical protein